MATSDYPPLIGGIATHIVQLSRALSRNGHDVTVLSTSGVQSAGWRFRTLGSDSQTGSLRVIQLGALGPFKRAQARRSMRLALSRLLRENSNPRVVHLHELHTPALLRDVCSAPLVWTNHTSLFLRALMAGRHADMQRTLSMCDWVTAPSLELRDATIGLGYPPQRTTYIPNGVNVAPQAQRDVRTVRVGCAFLVARRFVWKNGLHVLLDAIELLPRRYQSRMTFTFAGDAGSRDAYARSLRRRIGSLRSAGWRLETIGVVPNEAMSALYQSHDVAVVPSLVEATSITALEAMSAGLAVIGARTGGVPELLSHDGTGLLVAPGDAPELAEAMIELTRDIEKRCRLGIAAREVAVQRFNWDGIARKFSAVYCSVCRIRA